MIDPLVRDANPADAGQLEALGAEARASLVGRRGSVRWLERHPDRAGSWARVVAERTVLVALIDDVLVGYLVLDPAAESGRVALVEEVYVTSDAREVGFGDALLEAATARARASGAEYLEAEALPGDRETKNLYERAGITARLLTVSTRLVDD